MSGAFKAPFHAKHQQPNRAEQEPEHRTPTLGAAALADQRTDGAEHTRGGNDVPEHARHRPRRRRCPPSNHRTTWRHA
jgi:hypothetical protein